MAKILIVDDRQPNRDYLATLLAYGGHRLVQAADGAEALATARAERPDLVITDILMPTMDGYELVRQLRADPALAPIPVIFCTAHYREQEALALARSCGVSCVLTKPVDPQTVLGAVEAALGGAPPPLAPVATEDFDREHLRLMTDKLAQKANELKRTNERLAALIDLGLQLGSELDLRKLVETFGQNARDIIGARYAMTAIFDHGGPGLRHVFTGGLSPTAAAALGPPDPNSAVLRPVLFKGQCVRVQNPGSEAAALGLSRACPPIQALLAAPIESPTRIYGWLALIDKVGAEGFSDEDERLAKMLAAQLGRVYQNGSLYVDALQHASELEREVSDRKRAEQRQAILLDVSQALAEASNLHDAAQRVLRAIGAALEWDLGGMWIVDRPANVLRCVDVWHDAALPADDWKERSWLMTFAPGEGLPGRVWRDGKPIWLADIAKDANFPRLEIAAELGLDAAFAFPIKFEEQVLGVLEFFSRRHRTHDWDNDLSQLFTGISGPLGQFMERKQAEKALRAAQQRLQHVVASSPAVLYTLGVDGEHLFPTWVSDNVQEMMGYSAEEVYRPNWWLERVHPEDIASAAAEIRQKLFPGGRLAHEHRFRHRDGAYHWMRNDMRLLRDAAGKPIEVVGSWLDITERKQLEEQFRQAQKMEAVGRLAGGVAHDFNNLLTVINGYGEILAGSFRAHDPLRGFVEEIRKAGERAAALTRQLLAFSRKQMLVPVVLDINVLLDDIEKMLSRLIGEDIDLKLATQPELWKVKVDPGQMEQVVMNLVVNSRDAMPQGGKLTIETHNFEMDETYAATHTSSKTGQYVLLAVSDTGCGMDEATQSRIFEPFFSTKGEKGTGLGLATVFGIVKQSGGRIEVYSEPGLGAAFKIYLPRAEDEMRKSKLQIGPPADLRGSETVLLVEDEDGVRALAKLLLEKHGYKVLEARNGGEALLLCREHQADIHLMVTDVVMPIMSGQTLAQHLAPLRPGMKILYLSGYTDEAIVHHGVIGPETPFLNKPFSTDALLRKVRELLDQ
jgi:PAS domain S-box-containing protein